MSFLRDVVEKTLPIMNEDWTDATLYTHYQDEQAMMYEYAETLAIRVFLKMAGLPFRLEQRPNAEFMSPTTGQVPFLRVENSIIAEFSSIVEFVGKKGIKLSDALTATEQSDVQAYCSLVEETLRNAEKYLCWEHNKTYNLVTKQRYSSVYSWPLKLWLPALKRLEIRQYLSDIGWGEYTLGEVVNLCDKCFHVLSVKLGTQQYFVGDQPTELDACAFGHIYTILTTEMPDKGLISSLKKYPNLIAFCKNIDQNYFKN